MNIRFLFFAFLVTFAPIFAMDTNTSSDRNCCCLAASVMWRYLETEAIIRFDKSINLLATAGNLIAPDVKEKKD